MLDGDVYYFQRYETISYGFEYGDRSSENPSSCGRQALRFNNEHKYLTILSGGRTMRSKDVVSDVYYDAKIYDWV